MEGGSEIGALIEFAKSSPIAFIVVAPMLFSIWLILRTTKGRADAPKETDDDKILEELRALHATVKAGFTAVDKAQSLSLLETVRQGAKE